MEQNLSETPTNKIVAEMSRLEQEINLKIMKYELLRLEMIKRFPFLNNQSEFQPLEIKSDKQKK